MRLLLLAVLGACCLTACLVEGVGSEVPERRLCVSLTTKPLPLKRIKTYTIKEGSMRAVIFITRRGLKVCADPQHEWVKSAVKSIDSRSNSGNRIQTHPTGAQQTTHTAATLA
ncbi:lymphotactin [Fukomys damarensis]|uniref:Lymphotactin n=1 Tax=Fukomys damarensis TaxID=885580 RepID=A0A091DF53_FUKDA|nr:lymphotactin [Fukomys damarensis]KFO29123.1 Lymphotactin [Fukomys damarensis]